MPFTLTDDSQFYGLEIPLRNILMIGLFHSNNSIFSNNRVFLRQKKSNIKASNQGTIHFRCPHGRKMATLKWWRGVKMYLMSADFLVFKQRIYCSFLQIEGVVVTKLAIFCGRHKWINPKWFNITTNSIIRSSSFFFNINPRVRYILTSRKQPPASTTTYPSPYSTDD